MEIEMESYKCIDCVIDGLAIIVIIMLIPLTIAVGAMTIAGTVLLSPVSLYYSLKHKRIRISAPPFGAGVMDASQMFRKKHTCNFIWEKDFYYIN